MGFGINLIVTGVLLGAALAMDAFSVSMATGLAKAKMKRQRMCLIAGTFAAFQFLMPLLGRLFVGRLLQSFSTLRKFIPVAAFIILLVLGGKMILEGIVKMRAKKQTAEKAAEPVDAAGMSFGQLMFQGIATSLDALSVGFVVMAEYKLLPAVVACLIIGGVTFAVCIAGLLIGRKLGTVLEEKAFFLGGMILIAIGIEILIKG